jgi:hypothetical protein
MILSDLAKKWSSGLWKLLRPTELLKGIIDGYRISLNCLSGLHEIVNFGKVPVGVGSSYEVLPIAMSKISANIPVAGVSDMLDSVEYPYIITGIPSGIIYFCRSLSTVGACAQYDYVENDGIYYFKADPTKFGVISTRGEAKCTFLVFNPKFKATGAQDIDNKYCGSVDYFVNCEVHEHDRESGISNGVNQQLVHAAAGVSGLGKELSKVWTEGGKLFAITVDGELIRDYMADASMIGDKLNSGVLFTNSDGIVEFSEEAGVIAKKKAEGVISIDTTWGPDDAGAQKAICRRINLISNMVMYQRLVLDIDLEAAYTGMYVFYDDVKERTAPFVCAGMNPREAVYNNSGLFGVSRITFEAGATDAVSINGREYGSNLRCGKYIKAISFIKAGNSLASDVILSHIQVEPLLVHAGGCVVFIFK